MALRTLSGGLVHTPLLEGLPQLITEKWRQFFAESTEQSNRVATILRVSLPGLSASIPLTPFNVTDLPAGLYRVSVYTKVQTPASVNSSVQTDLVFTDDGDACTFVGTPNTANDVTRPSSEVHLLRIGEGTPISYQVTYVSNLAGMLFDLELMIEQMGS